MSAGPIKCILRPEAYFPGKGESCLFQTWDTEVPIEIEEGTKIIDFQDATPLILGALAGLTLGGLFCLRQLNDALMDLGESSEEIFRGQQLPFLTFPRRED